MRPKAYMNPYLAGFLLGLVLLGTIYITGRGLGASGAVKGAVVATVRNVAPQYAAEASFYKDYSTSHPKGLLSDWLVIEVIGLVVGAFFSGVVSKRIGLKLEKGPRATNKTRIIGALAGGFLFGLGSQFGRGCTSGAALSGMAVMSFGGIITMLAIFGGAYALAWFFRKLWIK